MQVITHLRHVNNSLSNVCIRVNVQMAAVLTDCGPVYHIMITLQFI